MREYRVIFIFLGSAPVHLRLVSGFITFELANDITCSDQLEACVLAFALLPRETASPAGGVRESFRAFASSTPPGWGRARWSGSQVTRVSFTAIWARPVCSHTEVLHERRGIFVWMF